MSRDRDMDSCKTINSKRVNDFRQVPFQQFKNRCFVRFGITMKRSFRRCDAVDRGAQELLNRRKNSLAESFESSAAKKPSMVYRHDGFCFATDTDREDQR
jgi:hypothetical protein